jgi:hypothetical protein
MRCAYVALAARSLDARELCGVALPRESLRCGELGVARDFARARRAPPPPRRRRRRRRREFPAAIDATPQKINSPPPIISPVDGTLPARDYPRRAHAHLFGTCCARGRGVFAPRGRRRVCRACASLATYERGARSRPRARRRATTAVGHGRASARYAAAVLLRWACAAAVYARTSGLRSRGPRPTRRARRRTLAGIRGGRRCYLVD